MINPSADLAFLSKAIDTFSKVDQRLLKEVVHFIFVMGEHITHRVDGAFLFLYQFGEIRFFIIHFLVFCPLDAGSSLKITKKRKKILK